MNWKWWLNNKKKNWNMIVILNQIEHYLSAAHLNKQIEKTSLRLYLFIFFCFYCWPTVTPIGVLFWFSVLLCSFHEYDYTGHFHMVFDSTTLVVAPLRTFYQYSGLFYQWQRCRQMHIYIFFGTYNIIITTTITHISIDKISFLFYFQIRFSVCCC